MHTRKMKVVGRSVSALAIGMTLTVGSASLASASGHHDHGNKGGDVASGKMSSFDYANVGQGGYVTAVTLTSVTVLLWSGTTTTYMLSPTTLYTEGQLPITLLSLVVGDRVNVQTSSTDPTIATSVNIELAELFGAVTAISGNTITITDPQGFSRTIGTAGTMDNFHGVVTAFTPTSVTVLGKHSTTPTTFTLATTTTFKDDGVSLSALDLAVGSKVGIEVSSAASTTALNVEIELAHLSGTVTAISGNTITIGGHEGSSRTILVTSTTTYAKGGAPATLADIVVGTKIRGEGTLSADELTLTAVSVVIEHDAVSTTDNDSQNNGHQGDQGSGGGGNQGSSSKGHHKH